jgi:hypothetical protein
MKYHKNEKASYFRVSRSLQENAGEGPWQRTELRLSKTSRVLKDRGSGHV